MGVLENARARAAKAASTVSEQGVYINPGAIYVLEVENVKAFQSKKNSGNKGVIEFKVISMTQTQADSYFAEKNPHGLPRARPNAEGSSCSSAYNMDSDYVFGLFLNVIAKISGDPLETLMACQPNSAALQYEVLIQTDPAAPPSPLKGLRVQCEAFEKENQDKTKTITGMKFTTLPPPEGHPLAA